MRKVKIGPGEHYVTRDREEIVVTVLGSCVSACIRDPVAEVGGMNHFMLPKSETGKWGGISATMRYGNFAMEQLINDILQRGGLRKRLEVKVFGAASMMSNGAAIGHQNADFVEAYLRAEDMPIAAHHLRGQHACRIEYHPLGGRVRLLEISLEPAHISERERQLFETIRAPENGSVELFD